jgi:hypothetical protein
MFFPLIRDQTGDNLPHVQLSDSRPVSIIISFKARVLFLGENIINRLDYVLAFATLGSATEIGSFD